MDLDRLATAFDAERPRLIAVASKVLRSSSDAEDAVQEAWLRLERNSGTDIDNLPGWLTTVVGRICLDHLRAGRSRATIPWDDVHLEADDCPGPADMAELDEGIAAALLLMMRTLTPVEQVTLVLHDAFGLPFDEVAVIVDKTCDATKTAASRARRKIREARAPVTPADHRRHRRVVDAFLAAGRGGDLGALVSVLDPHVVLHADTTHGPVTVLGAPGVADRARMFAPRSGALRPVRVGNLCAVVTSTIDGAPMSLMIFEVRDDTIVGIAALADAERLTILLGPG